MRRVLEVNPDHAGALHHLGLMLNQAGDRAQAIRLLARAVACEPRDAVCWNNLGNMLTEQGRLVEAVDAYRNAIRRRADYANAHYNLGLTLQAMGDAEAALDAFEAVLRLTPNDPGVWNKLGSVRLDTGDPDAAEEAHRKALRLDPNHVDALNGLGLVCMDQGKFDAAAAHYRRAIELDPGFTKAYLNLAKTRRFTVTDDADIARIEAGLEQPGLLEQDRVDIDFALGKIFDDLGDYDRAFEHYERANRLKRARLPADRAKFGGFVDAIIETFDRAFFESRTGYGVDSERLVFIVGMPRAGTSLLEQIIASHAAVFGAGEVTKINEIAGEMGKRCRTAVPYPRCAAMLGMEATRDLAAEYLASVQRRSPDSLRITDKMPKNYLHLGLIALLFPKARIIECRRDPMDVSLSIYAHQFTAPYAFGYDLGDIAFDYRQYERLMEHWRTVLPSTVHPVCYEALIREPETLVRQILEHCGLPWDERCLRFYETKRPVHTASNWQVRQPIYKGAAGRWRNYEKFLSELRVAFGR